MIKIIPIPVGYPVRMADVITIKPIISSTTALSCNTYYELLQTSIVEVVENTDIGQSLIVAVLANGNCPISEEQYAQWASDNTVLEDFVLETLGLSRA